MIATWDSFRDSNATDSTAKCPSCGRDSWYCQCDDTWAFTATSNYPPSERAEEFFAPSNRELFWNFVYQCAGLPPNRLNVGPYMAPVKVEPPYQYKRWRYVRVPTKHFYKVSDN